MVVDLKEGSTIDIISYALSKHYTDKQLQKLELGGTALTPESIVNTLGYTPADDVKVAVLIEEMAAKPSVKYGKSMIRYNHMPRVFFWGDTSSMTKENDVTLRFKYIGAEDYRNVATSELFGKREGGVIHEGFAKVKWQGSSSLDYPKKNYTIKLYSDEICETAMPIKFKERWGAQNKYCMKANYIDPSQCRNVLAAKLWGDCVRTRTKTSPSYQAMNSRPNYGAADGYPVLTFINDEYVGLYTMNIPKDVWMFGTEFGTGTNSNCVIISDAYTESTNFNAPALLDGSDWKYEIETMAGKEESIKASFNRIYERLSLPETTAEEIESKKATISSLVDIHSVIDYEIFIQRIGASDNMQKNLICVYYWGQWFVSAYDLDTAFGNAWTGTGYFTTDTERENNNLCATVKRLFAEEYAARKTVLESGVLSASEIIAKATNFVIDVPQEAYLAEGQIWTDMCGANTNAMQQIIAYIIERCR